MTKKVLFVDDDPILRHIIQKKFTRYKHSFTVSLPETVWKLWKS